MRPCLFARVRGGPLHLSSKNLADSCPCNDVVSMFDDLQSCLRLLLENLGIIKFQTLELLPLVSVQLPTKRAPPFRKPQMTSL